MDTKQSAAALDIGNAIHFVYIFFRAYLDGKYFRDFLLDMFEGFSSECSIEFDNFAQPLPKIPRIYRRVASATTDARRAIRRADDLSFAFDCAEHLKAIRIRATTQGFDCKHPPCNGVVWDSPGWKGRR